MSQRNQNMVKALQEKRVAEEKMISNDYAGARDNLRRAQQLFPAMDDIGSMLTVCDILSAAKINFPGLGIDYYWVLQLTPSSTFSAVGCRYQRLITILQSMTTKFPGTGLAMKLVEDAFSILSDHEKRSAYDLKRVGSREEYKSFNVKALSCKTTASKETIGCSGDSSCQTLGGSRRTTMFSKGIGTLEFKLQNFHGIDKQHGTINCQQPPIKVSVDLSSRENIGADSSSTSLQPANLEDNISCSLKSLPQKRPSQDFYNFENDRKPSHFEAGQIWAAQYRANLSHNFRYARVDCNSKLAACVTWLKPIPLSPGERRWRDAGLPVACGSFDLNPEMSIEESWPMVSSYKCSWVHGVTEEQFEIYPKRGEIWALYADWNLDEWACNPDSMKGCKFEFVEIISDFSKYLGANGACLVKVDGFRSIFERKKIGGNPVTFHIPPDNLYIFSHNVPAYRFKGGEIDKVVNGMFELDQSALPDIMIQEVDSQKAPKNGNARSFSSYNQMGGLPSLKSDPDDKLLKPNWSSNDFARGQVWAVYCGNDFLPRQYTIIDYVISESNQVCATYLKPLTILHHESDWMKENLPIVCGIFKVTGTSVNLEISQFSHSVECEKSIEAIDDKPSYRIYPLKGEIWAMYKNWNSKWKQSDYESYQCQFVQILSNLHEGDGITVARLEEVKGCLTFFHRKQFDGSDLTNAVSKADMLGFSHRIPAFRVPGIGKYGIPESSWQLEPNALPPRRSVMGAHVTGESQK